MDQSSSGFNITDQQFLQGYWETTLWKPQIVADNVLTGIYLADASYRSALAVLMLQECVESARRLATIVLGLTNSSGNLAQYLREPLAGATGWRSMVDIIENRSSAEELIEMLHLNFQAEQSVNELLDTRGLIHYAVPISLYEAGLPSVVIHPASNDKSDLVLQNQDRNRSPVSATIPLEEEQIVALGDATGDFVTWSRDFLGVFLDIAASEN
jgi:hypothetical protein|tara:strand:+ start:1560 stop:2198 length:639 start_codon:yes stop_codon:yes gene_type:complete